MTQQKSANIREPRSTSGVLGLLVDPGFIHTLLDPQADNSGDPEEDHGTALGRLMEFYESEEAADEEENEIDLMSQLYDMTSHNARSDD